MRGSDKISFSIFVLTDLIFVNGFRWTDANDYVWVAESEVCLTLIAVERNYLTHSQQQKIVKQQEKFVRFRCIQRWNHINY